MLPFPREASTSPVPARDTQPLGHGDGGPRWPHLGWLSLWSSTVLVPLSFGMLWRLNGTRPRNGVGWGCTCRSKKEAGTQGAITNKRPGEGCRNWVTVHTHFRRECRGSCAFQPGHHTVSGCKKGPKRLPNSCICNHLFRDQRQLGLR